MTCLRPFVIALAVLLVGCGGTDQREVVDMYLQAADEAGVTLDPACVRKTLGALSEADAQAIVDAGLDGNAAVSDQGVVIINQAATDCADVATYVESIVASISGDAGVDRECVRRRLVGLATIRDVDDAREPALLECSSDATTPTS